MGRLKSPSPFEEKDRSYSQGCIMYTPFPTATKTQQTNLLCSEQLQKNFEAAQAHAKYNSEKKYQRPDAV